MGELRYEEPTLALCEQLRDITEGNGQVVSGNGGGSMIVAP